MFSGTATCCVLLVVVDVCSCVRFVLVHAPPPFFNQPTETRNRALTSASASRVRGVVAARSPVEEADSGSRSDGVGPAPCAWAEGWAAAACLLLLPPAPPVLVPRDEAVDMLVLLVLRALALAFRIFCRWWGLGTLVLLAGAAAGRLGRSVCVDDSGEGRGRSRVREAARPS